MSIRSYTLGFLYTLYLLSIKQLYIIDIYFFVLFVSELIISFSVIVVSLIINLIILIFVNLCWFFKVLDSFRWSCNASFDILNKKIASCSFDILLCFINEIAKYEDDIIIHVSDKYNMNKYFIEYPKKQIYICFDGKDSFINLQL